MSARGSSHHAHDERRRWLIAACVGLGLFASALDTTVNVALPTIAEAFDADVSTIQWIIIAFVTTSTGLSVSMGSAGDRFGLWRLYRLGLVSYALAMVLIGVAPNLQVLVAFRVLQGVGAAAVMSVGPALVALAFAPGERGRALGVAGGTQAIGGVIAGFGGGVLIDALGWPAIFLGRLPFIAAALLLTVVVLRGAQAEAPAGTATAATRGRFDLGGAAALFVAVACLLVGLNLARSLGAASVPVIVLLAGAALVAGAFIRIERRAEWPVLDLALFGLRVFSAAFLTLALSWIGAFTIWFILPFFVADVLGRGASALGLLLGLLGLCTAIAAPLGGWAADRLRPEWLVTTAAAAVAAALLWISTLGTGASLGAVALPLALAGAGQGTLRSAARTLVFNSVPGRGLGSASGALNLGMSMGVVLSVALFSALFSVRQDAHAAELVSSGLSESAAEAPAFVAAFRETFRTAALVALAGAACSLFAWPRRRAAAAGAPPGA